MGGALAQAAKVIRGGNDASTEVPAPQSIYDDPGGEGVFSGSNPAGELKSAALFFGHDDLFSIGPSGGDTTGNFFAQRKVVAAKVDFDILSGIFAHAHDHEGYGEVFFEGCNFFAEAFLLFLGCFLFLLLSQASMKNTYRQSFSLVLLLFPKHWATALRSAS